MPLETNLIQSVMSFQSCLSKYAGHFMKEKISLVTVCKGVNIVSYMKE